MDTPFIGREALDGGLVTRHDLRGPLRGRVPRRLLGCGVDLTPAARARAAWLWSRRNGVPAGLSAAAVTGPNGSIRGDA